MIPVAQPKKRPAGKARNPKGKGRSVASEEVEEKKSGGKFQKAFFWVIIPLMFASAILLIFFQVTGTNVFDKVKNIAGVSQSASDNKTINSGNYDEQIVNLKSQIQEKEAEVKQLQDQMDQQKSESKKTQIEKKRLEKEVRKLKKAKSATNVEIETMVEAYTKMRPKSAAPALIAMKDDKAVEILSEMDSDTLAAILEKMPAENAANYTALLTKKEETSTTKADSSN